MDYLAHLARFRSADPDLAARLEGVNCLEHVLAWVQRSGLRMDGCDVLAQDEYSHDFLIPLGDGGRWVVFGMT